MNKKIKIGERMPQEYRECFRYPMVTVDCKNLIKEHDFIITHQTLLNQCLGSNPITVVGYELIKELIPIASNRLDEILPPLVKTNRKLKKLL
mgnify:CR=1 FL=1